MIRLLRVLGLVAVAASWAAPAAAASDMVARGAAPAIKRAPPVSVAGAPRSLLTLAVPVPTEFESADWVRFEVQISGAVDVMGRLEGGVDRASGARLRPVMLTLRVPANALVGLLDVADVIFMASDGRVVEVPIILRVPAVHVLRLDGPRSVTDLHAGDRLALTYRVQNLGNTTERLEVRINAPRDWPARVRDGEGVLVPAYGSTDFIVDVRVPASLNSGSLSLEVSLERPAVEDSAAMATTRTGLQLAQSENVVPGMVVSPFVGVATSGDGTAVSSGLRIAGPLLEDVFLQAEIAPRPSVTGLGLLGLGSVSAVGTPFNLHLSAPTWRLGAGNVSGMVSELTGLGFVGRGATGELRRGGVTYRAIAGRPFAGAGGAGHLVGGSAAWDALGGRVTASAASLVERGTGLNRELEAVGAEYSRDFGPNTSLVAGSAIRSFDDGSGLGLRLGVDHSGDAGRYSVSAAHVPGGAQAFGGGIDQLQARMQRDISDRVSVNASGSYLRDGGLLFRRVSSSALTLGARVSLASWLAARALASREENRAEAADVLSGGFGNAVHSLVIGSDASLGRWSLSGEVRGSDVARRTLLFSGGELERRAGQVSATVAASRGTSQWGTIGAGATYARTGKGIGVPGAAATGFLRWSSVPFAFAGQLLTLDNELRVQRSSLDRLRVSYRSGAVARLRNGIEMAATLERNPFLRDRQGREGWIAALRIGLSTEVVTSTRLERAGVAFRDDNANGRRDDGEPGIAGLMLRYDNLRFRTNREGVFRVPSSIRGRLEVDPQSIPPGLVVHPRTRLDATDGREVALVPTGTVRLVLTLVADPDGRVPQVNLEHADVWVRDADGYEWVGRPLPGGEFVFEHVPVGAYVVRTSFARLAEPVRADEAKFMLIPGGDGRVEIPVRGRNVRIITPPRQGGGRGGTGFRVAPRGARQLTSPQPQQDGGEQGGR